METKSDFRKKLKALTNTRENNSQVIVDRVLSQVLNHPHIINSQVLFIYVSTDSEVPTHELIEKLLDMGKAICVPKVINDQIVPVEIKSLKELKKGAFEILEPIQTLGNPPKIDCSVIPGVGYSVSGSRIGNGKGHYDKWGADNRDIYKIGLCFDYQIVPEFEKDAWDIDMNEMIVIST